MTEVVNITQTVDPNEKVWRFFETTKQSPGSRGMHRYEMMSVMRDGELAVYERDMGVASLFKGAKLRLNILGYWEHTVDEMRDIAQNIRYEVNIDLEDWLQIDHEYKLA